MPKKIKMMLIYIMGILCICAFYWFAFHPLLVKVKHTAEQVKMKEAELQLVKEKVAKIASLEATVRNAQNLDKTSIPAIPTKLTLSEIYAGIDALTRASGLRVKQISTNHTFQPFAKNHNLKYIAVNIRGNAYFPQMIQFLDSLSKSQFVIQVENLDLSSISKGSKPWLRFNLTLNAFEYVGGKI